MSEDLADRMTIEIDAAFTRTGNVAILGRWLVDNESAILAALRSASGKTAEELTAYREAAQYDATMEGPRFKGWDRSQLDRARAMTERKDALTESPNPHAPLVAKLRAMEVAKSDEVLREHFERWYSTTPESFARDPEDGSYALSETDLSWKGWRAAAKAYRKSADEAQTLREAIEALGGAG